MTTTTNSICKENAVCKDNLQNMYSSSSESLAKKHLTDAISYDEWRNKTDVRKTNKGETTVMQMTLLRMCARVLRKICKIFASRIKDSPPICRHSFIKNKVAENECVLQIGFRKNYTTKSHTEIQSMHFGGNREQISIHTCYATFV